MDNYTETSKSVPGSACPVNRMHSCHALHVPMRERGDAILGRRLSRTKKQPMRERQRRAQQPVPPSSSEEARQQAQAEGLTLRVADNTTG